MCYYGQNNGKRLHPTKFGEDEDLFSVQLPLPQLSYPSGGGEHVLFSELEAVDLLQDHSAVVFALEEVGAAEYGGDTLGFVSLDQHCGGGVVGLHSPKMG